MPVRRGFAAMDKDKQREIASKGGTTAHKLGRAHQWTQEEASEAGRKGGLNSHKNRKLRKISGTAQTAVDNTADLM